MNTMHDMTTPPIFQVLTRSVRAEEIPTMNAVALVSNPTGSSSGNILTQVLNVGIEVVSEVVSFLSGGAFQLHSELPGGENVGRTSFSQAITSIFNPGVGEVLVADGGSPVATVSPGPVEPVGDPALFVHLFINQADVDGVAWDVWHPVADSSYDGDKRSVLVRFSDGTPDVTLGALEQVEVATVQNV